MGQKKVRFYFVKVSILTTAAVDFGDCECPLRYLESVCCVSHITSSLLFIVKIEGTFLKNWPGIAHKSAL